MEISKIKVATTIVLAVICIAIIEAISTGAI